jgi:hypothetical protein
MVKLYGHLDAYNSNAMSNQIWHRGRSFNIMQPPSLDFNIRSNDMKQLDYLQNMMATHAKEDFEISHMSFIGCFPLTIEKNLTEYTATFSADSADSANSAKAAIQKYITIFKNNKYYVFVDENKSHRLYNKTNDTNNYSHITNGQGYSVNEAEQFWNMLIKNGWRMQ